MYSIIKFVIFKNMTIYEEMKIEKFTFCEYYLNFNIYS